jgi:type II secretory pathway predicted ATPase ExeA
MPGHVQTSTPPALFQRLERSLVPAMGKRLAAVHPGLSILSGPPGTGKTEIVRDLRAQLNQTNQKTALYFYLTIAAAAYDGMQTITLLYEEFLGPRYGWAKRQKPEALLGELVERLKAQGTQWLFVDEAGLLSHPGLNMLLALFDTAVHRNYPLSLVLVGNDDLALKVQRRPQFENRLKEWLHVEPYSYDQLREILPRLDLSFAGLAPGDLTRLAQFLHTTYAGNLRSTRAFLERLHARWSPDQPLQQIYLQAAVDQIDRGKQQATAEAVRRSHRSRK